MKLTLEEVEREIIGCMAEMDAFEYKALHARIKRDPLAPGYHKAFIQAGQRLSKLRQHRSLLDGGFSWRY